MVHLCYIIVLILVASVTSQPTMPQLKTMTQKERTHYRVKTPLDETLLILNQVISSKDEIKKGSPEVKPDYERLGAFYDKLTKNPRPASSFLLNFIEADPELNEVLKTVTQSKEKYDTILEIMKLNQEILNVAHNYLEDAKSMSREIFRIFFILSEYPAKIDMLNIEIREREGSMSQVSSIPEAGFKNIRTQVIDISNDFLKIQKCTLKKYTTALEQATTALEEITKNDRDKLQKYHGLEILNAVQKLAKLNEETARLVIEPHLYEYHNTLEALVKRLLILLKGLKDKKDPTEADEKLWKNINGYKESLRKLSNAMGIENNFLSME